MKVLDLIQKLIPVSQLSCCPSIYSRSCVNVCFDEMFKLMTRCFKGGKFWICKMKKYSSIDLCGDICASPSRSNKNSMSCHLNPNVEFRVSQTPREYGMLFFLQIIWIGKYKQVIYLKLFTHWIFVSCNEATILHRFLKTKFIDGIFILHLLTPALQHAKTYSKPTISSSGQYEIISHSLICYGLSFVIVP